MEIWRLLAVITTVSVLTCNAQEMFFAHDKKHWLSKNWENKPLVDTLVSEVASLIKRSKAHQFYGLMGKRDISQHTRLGQKRNKGETFVGLMGRSLRGETFTNIIPSETVPAIQSDLQEEWDNSQYY